MKWPREGLGNAMSDKVPFEFLPEREAMDRTPYRTRATFRAHYGDLYREPGEGQKGGYLATDLQERTEQFRTNPRS